MTPADWFKDTLERAVSTFILFGVTLLAAGSAVDMSFAHQVATAGIAAVLVVVSNALPGLNFSSQNPFFDVLQRAAKSSVQAGFAILVAAGSGWLDVSVWQGAGMAALAAGAAVIKGWIALRIHPAETITPASLVTPASVGSA